MLHAATTKALSAVFRHLASPRHLGLVVYLPMLAQCTLQGALSHDFAAGCSLQHPVVLERCHALSAGQLWEVLHPRCSSTGSTLAWLPCRMPWKDMTILLSQLAAVQRLAAAWLSSPPMEARSSMRAEDPLTEVELMSFADQVGHDGV